VHAPAVQASSVHGFESSHWETSVHGTQPLITWFSHAPLAQTSLVHGF